MNRPLLNLFVSGSGSLISSDLGLNKLRLDSRFGDISYAHKLFDEIPEPNAFLWTSLIYGFTESHQYENAFTHFSKMQRESVVPLNLTFASVFKALGRLGRVKDGEVVYGITLKLEFGFDLVNATIDFFMRRGKVEFARRVFCLMEERDVVSWNSMITGYRNNGKVSVARKLFDNMEERNLVSWTNMIQGYCKAGDMEEASILFERIPAKDAIRNVMLSAYMSAGNVVSTWQLFERMPINDSGTWNFMVSGFSKAGDLESAKEFFDRIRKEMLHLG